MTTKTPANIRKKIKKPLFKARLILMGVGSLMDLTGHYSYHQMQTTLPEPQSMNPNLIMFRDGLNFMQSLQSNKPSR